MNSIAILRDMSKRAPLSPTPEEDAKRLRSLFNERAAMTQAEFGERFGIGNQGAIWQYLNNRRPLNISAAQKFAEGLGVRIEDFSPSIAQAVQAADAWTGEAAQAWPYATLDEKKFRNLPSDQAARLEAAIIGSATALGLDVKKDA